MAVTKEWITKTTLGARFTHPWILLRKINGEKPDRTMSRTGLLACVFAIIGTIAMAQESKTQDELKLVIDTIRAYERERYRGDMSVPRADGELLRRLVEENDVRHAVEIGTFRGYSGLWLGLGLLRTGGRLTTFEINSNYAAEARARFERAGLADTITVVVGDAQVEIAGVQGPIDLLFLDANPYGYIGYLEQLLPELRIGGLVVTHNVKSPRPDPAFIRAITTNPDLETRFVHMDGSGIAITRKLR
ncbi:MAG: class I SAM-dependent methyltransferase [Planctomycetes bacterium]|nr:class I SAM-dependent methyltransferase [Planctomycetota bacterium]